MNAYPQDGPMPESPPYVPPPARPRSSMRAGHSDSLGKLARALSRVQAQLKPIRKNETAAIEGKAKYAYKFAPLEDIVPILFPLLAAEGLALVQMIDVDGDDAVLVSQLVHGESGEWIRGVTPIRPTQRTPQAFGSAVTYARRYALCALVGVTTYEDDDAAAAMGYQVQHAVPYYPPQAYQPAPQQWAQPAPQVAPPADDFPPSWGGNGAPPAPAQQPEPPTFGLEVQALERFTRALGEARTSGAVATLAIEAKAALPPEQYAAFREQCGAKYELLADAENAGHAAEQGEPQGRAA